MVIFMVQEMILADGEYSVIADYIKRNRLNKIFIVCDASFQFLNIGKYLKNIEKEIEGSFVFFSDFNSNPVYESVINGVRSFRNEVCDAIFAIGGGSTIDMAKCIKLYSGVNPQEDYFKQKIAPSSVEILAMPTTAGTGSESTKFAVIYYNGEKQSVSDERCIPSAVLFDVSALKSLPEYQRKSTMMDALCHAIESFWSVNSTKESRKYSKEAIRKIVFNMDGYLANKDKYNEGMLYAANFAGKAINIAQTTAGHAMCYKLTSLYGIAHGHAAALCVSRLLPYMIKNIDKCIDLRGSRYLTGIFNEIAETMGCNTMTDMAGKFQELIRKLGLEIPKCSKNDISILKKSVNPVRLRNNPIVLTEDVIDMLYNQILNLED